MKGTAGAYSLQKCLPEFSGMGGGGGVGQISLSCPGHRIPSQESSEGKLALLVFISNHGGEEIGLIKWYSNGLYTRTFCLIWYHIQNLFSLLSSTQPYTSLLHVRYINTSLSIDSVSQQQSGSAYSTQNT